MQKCEQIFKFSHFVSVSEKISSEIQTKFSENEFQVVSRRNHMGPDGVTQFNFRKIPKPKWRQLSSE